MLYKSGDIKKYGVLFPWIASVINGDKVCYITHAKFLYGQKKLTQRECYALCTSFNNVSLNMFHWPSVVNCKEQRSFASSGCGNFVKYQTVLTPMEMSVTQAFCLSSYRHSIFNGGKKVYTVCLLSFRTGIIKSICVKEMILLLFSFRRTSLPTVHTDLHVHTASGCLCRSCPLQWRLMYLSRLAACRDLIATADSDPDFFKKFVTGNETWCFA